MRAITKSSILSASIITILAATQAMAGELKIVGTGDGVDLLKAVGTAFQAENPSTTIDVPPSIGSGGGIAAVGSDKEVLARIARPLSEAEKSSGLIETPFVKLPSAIFTHPSVSIKNLTTQQLADIFSGKITNWNEVGGTDIKIRIVRREDADSTLQVLRKMMPGWSDLAFTEKSKTAVTTQEAIECVKVNEGAIGFGPYSLQLEAGLNVLRIDTKYPTDQGYPSAATVAFAYKPATITEEAKKFISYATSAKAKAILMKLGGVPALTN